jgi:hypothetical protein
MIIILSETARQTRQDKTRQDKPEKTRQRRRMRVKEWGRRNKQTP